MQRKPLPRSGGGNRTEKGRAGIPARPFRSPVIATRAHTVRQSPVHLSLRPVRTRCGNPPLTCHCEPVPQHWCGNPPVRRFLPDLRLCVAPSGACRIRGDCHVGFALPSTCHCETSPQTGRGNPPVRRLPFRPRGNGYATAFGGVAASDVVRIPGGIATSASPPRNDSIVHRGSNPPSTCHCEPVPQHWCGNPPVNGTCLRLRPLRPPGRADARTGGLPRRLRLLA